MKNKDFYIIAAILAGLLLFRKNLGIGRLFEGQGNPLKAMKFRYTSKGMKGAKTITANEIMDTDYWPNEIDNKGTSISEFVFNAGIMDKWQNDIETIIRIK